MLITRLKHRVDPRTLDGELARLGQSIKRTKNYEHNQMIAEHFNDSEALIRAKEFARINSSSKKLFEKRFDELYKGEVISFEKQGARADFMYQGLTFNPKDPAVNYEVMFKEVPLSKNSAMVSVRLADLYENTISLYVGVLKASTNKGTKQLTLSPSSLHSKSESSLKEMLQYTLPRL